MFWLIWNWGQPYLAGQIQGHIVPIDQGCVAFSPAFHDPFLKDVSTTWLPGTDSQCTEVTREQGLISSHFRTQLAGSASCWWHHSTSKSTCTKGLLYTVEFSVLIWILDKVYLQCYNQPDNLTLLFMVLMHMRNGDILYGQRCHRALKMAIMR